MRKSNANLALGLTACIALVILVAPAVFAAAPTYPANAITKTAIVQAKIGGYQGVLVNYTSSFSSSFDGFVYMDLTNSAGQTVAWAAGYCSFSPGAKAQCFAAVPLSLASGSYTASVFVVTSTGVTVSGTSSLKVTI